MSGLNLLVFRGDRRRANGKEMKAALIARLEQFRSPISLRAMIDVLLLAGEFECGVADAYPEAANSCERLTDQIAALLISESAASTNPDFQKPDFQSLLNSARALPPVSNSVSPLLKVSPITHFIHWLTRMSFVRFLHASVCWLWESGASAQR